MRFGNFIFGVALLLVATTLALTITFRNEPQPQVATSGQQSAEAPRSSSPSGRAGTFTPRGSIKNGGPRPAVRSREIEVEDMDLVLGMGAQAAAAIENVRLYRDIEGERMARERVSQTA